MNEIESMRYFQDLYDRFADKPGEVYWARVHNQTTREAIETALTALREKAEREKGCDHCRGWDSRCGANYCPMCGRELGKRLEVEP